MGERRLSLPGYDKLERGADVGAAEVLIGHSEVALLTETHRGRRVRRVIRSARVVRTVHEENGLRSAGCIAAISLPPLEELLKTVMLCWLWQVVHTMYTSLGLVSPTVVAIEAIAGKPYVAAMIP